ncbi:MAG TPA: class I SAM-dependent methyltransferase [Steroidobacteraceae bacterium]
MMLSETRRAFDSVAGAYDGPRGNNALIQDMRALSWRLIERQLLPHSRLLDIGCGTGIDALHFATLGHSVCAIDASGGMIARAREQAAERGLQRGVDFRQLGAQELERLEGSFDLAYSNFGPLNCVPDLHQAASQCARLLTPQGLAIFTVMGRFCPWETAYYLLKGRGRRASVRFARKMTAVGLNGHTAWVHYYTPHEFYRCFSPHFSLVSYQALSLWMPPPYLLAWHERHVALGRALRWLDERTGSWPLLRNAGDHFLMILRKRP